MTAFVPFVRRLLEDGSVRLRRPPHVEPAERSIAQELLAEAYADYRLDVAGPLVPFDAAAALDAAEWLWRACWFLLRRRGPAEEVERGLPAPTVPVTAAQHLSADLVGRFLPQVHRRARALAVDDPLTRWLEGLLRRWPLTGVLADVAEGPLTPVELDGHPGLLLLYAERLAENVRPTWVPEGAAREYVELVFAERGLVVPVEERATGTDRRVR
jgi:hypothetical protein